jgi:hypothetical protein
MATNCYTRWKGLSIRQLDAVELVVLGKTDQQVAEEVGVHRVTVTRWRNYDLEFIAELNRRRRQVCEASTNRLRALLPKAFDALEDELENGTNRGRVAMDVIKLSGIASGRNGRPSVGLDQIGAEDPDVLLIERAEARNLSKLLDVPDLYGISDHDLESLTIELEGRLNAPLATETTTGGDAAGPS